ncbi:MAG: RNA pseudouridine synthase, partial [Proteobacteria bacterium]
SERQAQKTYLAVVERGVKPWPKTGEPFVVKNYLKRGEGKGALMRSVRSGGDVAETEFTVLSVSDNRALIQAKPKTGRMHQIRVHLSELGFPIVGDEDYGARSSGRTLLHAAKISFNHPISKAPLTIEAPLSEDFNRALLNFKLKI